MSLKDQLISSQTILLGSSFGGPASILASTHPQIDKVCAISPVIDWTKPGKEEPIDQLKKFTAQAFGQGYRPVKNAFEKLASGKFYNPINSIEQINGKKLLLIHAKDDQICPYQTTKKFAQATQSKLITLNQGGHLSSSTIMLPKYYKLFKNFINAK
ncbi:MAG: prolyl oligopeptidase family serine peptidase [Candidatus Doudnabacteria bacterium]